MKTVFKSLFLVVLALAMVLGAGPNGVVKAATGARDTAWVVSVTYQNVGTGTATIGVNFYPEGSATAIPYTPAPLNAGAAASFYIGSVSGIGTGFKGNAVMSSNQPLIATVVQFHNNAAGETVKMRMLSNGFTAADVSNAYLVPTALNTERTTVFSIQNIENATITATVKFYDTTGALTSTKAYDIVAGSSKFVDMDDAVETGVPDPFNGSALVTAVLKSDGVTAANVVVAISELYDAKFVGGNFEGVPLSRASNKIYMATALCGNGGGKLQTYYAVQNANQTPADSLSFNVKYYRAADGVLVATDGPYTLDPGVKKSIVTCSMAGTLGANFSGSAVIEAVDAADKLVVIGKAQPITGATADVADLFAIFMGEPQGYSKIALPFVRWANDANYNAAGNLGGKQRTYIAIQNLETTAKKVDVIYKDKSGNTVATQTLTIPGLSKGSSNASAAGAISGAGMITGEFGYYTDATSGGGVIIQAHADNPTAKFIAIARCQNPGAGEDYNAVSIP